MKVSVSTTTTRTLVPIVVDVRETSSEAIIEVKPLQIEGLVDPFTVTTHEIDNRQQAQFWIQQPGDYEITVLNNGETFSQQIHVEPQIFLPFSIEFGFFFVLMSSLFIGVVLWFSKKAKAHNNRIANNS